MGNNFCSICNNQTSITSINQLSLNLQRNNSDNSNRRNKILESLRENNKESIITLNDLSFSQEIDTTKLSQSLYVFNNLIFLVDKNTYNIINNNINNKTKIKSQYIKDLFFICNYKDYNIYKGKGIFAINEFYLVKVGIPKEIYKNKGLNCFKRENFIEIFFVNEKKMIKIVNASNLEEKSNNNKNSINKKKQIHNRNIINNINNLNNIHSFSKTKTQIEKDFQSDSISKNFVSIKPTKENNNEESTFNNINNELMDSSIVSIASANSLNVELESTPVLIFQTLLLLAEEENKILNSLNSTINIKNVSDYCFISGMWLNEYKTIFNYNEVKNLYKERKNNNKDENDWKITKKDINDLVNNSPKILDSIKDKLNNNKSKFIDFKKLSVLIKNKNINDDGKLKMISIPYNFSLINKNILNLILKQFDFKCKNIINKKDDCNCEFCESAFLKKYKCYIGNHIILIYNNNIENKRFNYYVCKNSDENNISIIKILYLLLFRNNDSFISEINSHFSKGKKLNDYLRIKNFKKNEILQDLFDEQKNCIGQIINFKKLINKEEDITFNSKLKKSEKNEILRTKTIKKDIIKKESLSAKPLLSYKKPALIGLNRNGQPYFFNSVLQCLSNIPELTNYFLYNNFANDDIEKIIYPFSYNYSILINELWKKPSEEDSEMSNYPYYKKSFFAFQIKEFLLNLNSAVLQQQKDKFRELFIYIIKTLDIELNQFESKKSKVNFFRSKTFVMSSHKQIGLANNNNSMNNNNKNNNIDNKIKSSSNSSYTDSEEQLLKKFRYDYYGNNNSIIQKNFYSEIEVFYQCIKCETYNYHYEIVNSFTFDLELIKINFLLKYNFHDIKKKTIILNLADCFEYLEKPNNLLQNIPCKQCSFYSLEKQIRILKPSNILVLFFKEKEVSHIEFNIPFDLQLNPFIHNQTDNEDNNNLKLQRNTYDLICVLCNPPDQMKKYNYWAYCKNPVNKWWYGYNDSIVTNVDSTFIKNIKIPKMLIYRKKELINLTFMVSYEQTFDLEVSIDMLFRDVVFYLYDKYSSLKELKISYFIHNDKELDFNKKVYQNNLSNGAIILCRSN